MLQGGLLALLCQLSNAQRVLEVGTFTGYSALVLAGCPGGVLLVVCMKLAVQDSLCEDGKSSATSCRIWQVRFLFWNWNR